MQLSSNEYPLDFLIQKCACHAFIKSCNNGSKHYNIINNNNN